VVTVLKYDQYQSDDKLDSRLVAGSSQADRRLIATDKNVKNVKNDNKNPLSPKADDAQQVFDYWCSVFNKSTSTKLTPKRKAKVIKRLEDGYTLEDIKSAIDGCSRSAHHMGQNDSGTIYDDIELICRTGEKLEQFMTNYNNAPAPKQTKSDQSINNCQEWATDDRTGQSGILEINAVSGRDIQQDDHPRLTNDLL
jgi:DNA-binding transcriptional MerR regulator